MRTLPISKTTVSIGGMAQTRKLEAGDVPASPRVKSRFLHRTSLQHRILPEDSSRCCHPGVPGAATEDDPVHRHRHLPGRKMGRWQCNAVALVLSPSHRSASCHRRWLAKMAHCRNRSPGLGVAAPGARQGKAWQVGASRNRANSHRRLRCDAADCKLARPPLGACPAFARSNLAAEPSVMASGTEHRYRVELSSSVCVAGRSATSALARLSAAGADRKRIPASGRLRVLRCRRGARK